MSNLILVRHGQTSYNEKGIWTGQEDPSLTHVGRLQSQAAGRVLASYAIDIAFTSGLKRAYQTYVGILTAVSRDPQPFLYCSSALNERDYGIYTGKSKQDIRAQLGDTAFTALRRSWDYKVDGGESLADVHARIKPYHDKHIRPFLKDDCNVLVVSSNNALRAYIKEIENVDPDNVADIELGTGEVRVYGIDKDMSVTSKEVLQDGPVH